MKLYVHIPHSYEDRGRKRLYQFPPNHVVDIPDEVGAYMLREHPLKFCDVTNELQPNEHKCEKGRYEVQSISQPPRDTMLVAKLSAQKRQLLRQARKRSLHVRRNGKDNTS